MAARRPGLVAARLALAARRDHQPEIRDQPIVLFERYWFVIACSRGPYCAGAFAYSGSAAFVTCSQPQVKSDHIGR